MPGLAAGGAMNQQMGVSNVQGLGVQQQLQQQGLAMPVRVSQQQ
jgi:hypothetical protein